MGLFYFLLYKDTFVVDNVYFTKILRLLFTMTFSELLQQVYFTFLLIRNPYEFVELVTFCLISHSPYFEI